MKNFKSFILFAAVFFIISAVAINSQPVNLNENDLSFEDATTAMLVGQDGLIMRTTDGGTSWITIQSGVTNSFNAIDYKAATPELVGADTVIRPFLHSFGVNAIAVAVGENGIIMVSEDGVTWTASNSGTLVNLKDVYIHVSGSIYVCGESGTLLVSGDRGLTWEAIPLNTTVNLNSITFSNTPLVSSNVVIAGDGGLLLVSHDNGFSWLAPTPKTVNNLNAVAMGESDMMIAVGEGGIILKSVDQGDSWTEVVTEYSGTIHDLRFLNGLTTDVFTASGDNGAILRSEDLGSTWSVVQTGSQSDLFALNFYDTDNGISVGESGTELYTSDGGLTWINKEVTDNKTAVLNENSSVKLNQNYPNPFNPSTLISYTLPFDAKVNISVYDMLGRVVANLLTANQVTGTHTVNFNASGLSSGVYFYKLNAESGNQSFTRVMKMILTK